MGAPNPELYWTFESSLALWPEPSMLTTSAAGNLIAMDMNAEMAKHAQAAAEMVLEEYGHELDFSEPTIGAIESLLNGFWQEGGNTHDFLAKVALLFGLYIGEMIRSHWPEAKWIGRSLEPAAPPPALQMGDIEISPIVWCYKRLHNGPADSVVKKYLAFRKAIAESE